MSIEAGAGGAFPVEAPKFQTEPGKQPDPEALKRLKPDWQEAVNITWQSNRPMFDRVYTAEKTVQEDLSAGGKTPETKEIQTEIAKRKSEQAETRKIGELDEAKVAQELIASEEKFKGLKADDAAVKEEAAKIAGERKQKAGIIKAMDDLYASADAKTAYQKALSGKKKDYLDRLTVEAQKKDANAASVTEDKLSEVQKKELETELAQIPQTEYYDEAAKTAYLTDPQTGEFVLQEGHKVLISETNCYQPIYDQVVTVAELPAEKQTEETPKAQQLLKTLHYDREQGVFTVKSREQREQEELTALVGAAADELHVQIPLIRDANGKISGFDKDKLAQLFRSEDGKDIVKARTLGRLEMWISIYNGEKTPDHVKANIASIISYELAELNPGRLTQLNLDPDFMKSRIEDIMKGLQSTYRYAYLEVAHMQPTLLPKVGDLLDDTLIAAYCEDHLIENPKTGEKTLPTEVASLLQSMGRSPEDKAIILHMASAHAATPFLLNELGISSEMLLDPKANETFANGAIKAIATRRSSLPLGFPPEERQAILEGLTFLTSEEGLRELANKKKIGWDKLLYSGFGIMFLLQLLEQISGKDMAESQAQPQN